MQADAIDQVIKSAIEVMESSKYQIFDLAENARHERNELMKEQEEVKAEAIKTIDLVDKLELDLRRSRIRLSEVSRDFRRFHEADIKTAYDNANLMQLQLTLMREKENHLRTRRDELQKRIKSADKLVQRAERIVFQMDIVLGYLSGDLSEVSHILETAKNRQMLGLKIILAQEEERRRIAREIHDGMAQTLANLVLRSEIAERLLAKQEYDVVKEELQVLKSQVRGGLEEVRKMIFNLRPMALDDLGLVPAVRKYAQDFEERTRILTKLEVKGKEMRLPSGMEAAIFRLIQEAFSNVFKHAKATFVEVELLFGMDYIHVKFSDNGIGFNVGKTEQIITNGTNFGILGMRERLDLLEGKMEIVSEINLGTKINMEIPIRPQNKEENTDG
ncbi:histidine kinase [Paenibacillus sp. N1-5-1-14]|uniref:sensor histidine kinase n=1 Tax=Paenibacillus radicibacter TaxID=2972488 RepID=UPI0021599F7F|nr:sensor histidine kinase [Paenibacillus radicibacter]MCR8645051.1 histidine kinase [Paenibacillus radicibacter]